MIQIKIEKQKGYYKTITFKGHAMYDDYGKDIVCAGVSSILITTVNAILKFDEKALTIKEEADVVLNILKQDEITINLLENMVSLLYELKESYPKNITIREDEKNE